MSIVVTPIPQLIELAAPAFTLGTANAAGSAGTAVASDSTLLAFDTTDPAAVAASAVVGSATTAPRRDHVHPGIVGAGTVVDEAIARFNGTSGDSLQGYSSLSPTISDAGILSLTSGALKFPATAIASADPNTLSDYEIGTWTAAIKDSGGNAAGIASQVGRYTRIGNRCFCDIHIVLNSISGMTGSSGTNLSGLPFTAKDVSGYYASVSSGRARLLNFTALSSVAGYLPASTTTIALESWYPSTGSTALEVDHISADGDISLFVSYEVE